MRPRLPINYLSGSCAVKYAEDQVFVIGGVHEHSVSNRVFIFNPLNGFSHTEGPPLKAVRMSHSCAIMSNGQDKKIVVAGGTDNYYVWDTTVEIFDPYFKNWISG